MNTRYGESHVALINADTLGLCHHLGHDRIHRLLIDDARQGPADIAAGRTLVAHTVLAGVRARCASARPAGSKGKPKGTGGSRSHVAHHVGDDAELSLDQFAFHPSSQLGGLPQALAVSGTRERADDLLAGLNQPVFGSVTGAECTHDAAAAALAPAPQGPCHCLAG